jgi:hypothetical protein
LRANWPPTHAQRQSETVHLYYLYLRTEGDPGLFEANAVPDKDAPAALNRFFEDLGISYRGFEAENPEAIRAAVDTINRLETSPVPLSQAKGRRWAFVHGSAGVEKQKGAATKEPDDQQINSLQPALRGTQSLRKTNHFVNCEFPHGAGAIMPEECPARGREKLRVARSNVCCA